MKIILSCLTLCFAWCALGTDENNILSGAYDKALAETNSTNVLYVTDDGHIYLETVKKRWINPRYIVEAKTNRESWPAKDFPEGNWGELDNGIQVSLRFGKQIYTNQEPIKAIVLVRNTTNGGFIFDDSNDVAPGMVNFLAYTESNVFVTQKPRNPDPRMPSGRVNVVGAGLQIKHVDSLNRTYDLPNGNYLVQASITAYYAGQTNTTFPNGLPREIKSAKVPITIRNFP
jgi:hypothetical protein